MLQGKPDNSAKPVAAGAGPDAGTMPARLRDLYRRHQEELRNYIRSRFGGGAFDPEDIVQAAFIRFAEQEEPDKIDNPRAFLYTTARNLAVDELRKTNIRLAHRQSARQDGEGENSDNLTPENVLSDRQKCELLRQSLEKLPEIQRNVLVMHRFERLTYAQISRATGLSESKIRRHIAGAMQRIIQDLKRAERF